MKFMMDRMERMERMKRMIIFFVKQSNLLKELQVLFLWLFIDEYGFKEL